jgi:hypothetical protein
MSLSSLLSPSVSLLTMSATATGRWAPPSRPEGTERVAPKSSAGSSEWSVKVRARTTSGAGRRARRRRRAKKKERGRRRVMRAQSWRKSQREVVNAEEMRLKGKAARWRARRACEEGRREGRRVVRRLIAR